MNGSRLIALLCQLQYAANEHWRPLPQWAQFLLRLGYAVSNHYDTDSHFVLAISVPIRSFAAVLVGSGLIVTRAVGETSGIQRQLDLLQHLPEETPVIYRNQGRKYKALLLGMREFHIGGQATSRIALQTEQATIEWVPVSDATCIEVLEDRSIRLPKRQKGYALSSPSPVLSWLLSENQLDDFVSRSQFDCYISAPLAALHAEALETRIVPAGRASSMSPDVGESSFADLLRSRSLLRPGAAYRSIAESSLVSHSVDTGALPYVCIFDGALSFLKGHRDWYGTNHIVILDQTERSYGDAVREVNGIYDRYSLGSVEMPDFPGPIAGVEVMYFEVPK